MITDGIMLAISACYKGLLLLIPQYEWLQSIVDAKDQLVEFLGGYMPYALWFFNIPILAITVAIMITYIVALLGEYSIKLTLRYTTRVL